MNARLARWIAWSLVGIYFVLMGSGLVSMVLTHTTIADIPFPSIFFIIVYIMIGIWPVIGALVVTHHPRHPVGWLLFATFPLAAIDVFSFGYASYVTSLAPVSLPIPGVLLLWLNWSAQSFVTVSFTLMNLVFPSGKLPSPRWRAVAWGSVAALLAYLTLQTLEPGPLALFPSLTNPYAVGGPVWAALMPIYFAVITLLTVCNLASVVSLFLRLRQAQGDERQQVKWLVLPAFIFWISLPFGFLSQYEPISLFLVLGMIPVLLSVPGIVIAVAFSIFKYRLYDIDLIINRTLVYGALTVCVVGIYALIVGGLGMLFESSGNLAIELVATGLVAVLFNPLRQRLQRAVNRLLYGERDEPFSVLRRLGERLESSGTPEDLLPTIVETIGQALRLPYAEITLRYGEKFECAARYGEHVGEMIPFPIQYQSQTIGYLNVAPRGSSETFGKSDEGLLRQIAWQAGPIAYAAQLTQDLRQSRSRLVTTREEERRRLRRDLHDGLGPVLASQGLKIAAVRHLLDTDPQTARKLLDDLASQNEATVSEIRRLVYALRPPELDELGLAGAVRDYAAGLDVSQANGTGFEVNVQPSDGALPLLPAAVEVAAYRIATEALTNVTRHAQARHCTVSFRVESGGKENIMFLEITDDGVGLSKNGKAGIGLNSMRERVEEVRGKFTVESAPHQGTRIVASFPLVE